MKILFSTAAIVALLGAPAFADQKVDDAVAKANDQLQKGKPEEALKTIQKLASSPSAEAQLAAGRFLERLGNLSDAAAAYTKAGETGVGSVKAEALAALAFLKVRTGPAKAALAIAEQAVQVESTPSTLAALAMIQARLDTGKALQIADQAVAAGPTSSAAQAARGLALLAQDRSADAATAFRKALELDPKNARARIGLASALTAQGKGAEAVAEARKVTTEEPNIAEGHAVLGLAMVTENPKAWNDAIAEAQDAAFKNKDNAEIQMAVAKIFEIDGRFDQATEAYKKTLELDPDFGPTRAALINVQFKRGDLDGALAVARQLVQSAPGNGEAQLKLGELLLRKQDYAGAVAPLEKATQLLTGSADANYYLGRAYHFTNRIKDALGPYRRAAELAPSNLEYRSTYGLVLGINEQYEAAAAELQKVVATPGYKDSAGYTNLGWVYRNMRPQKTAEAIAAYKKALELDPKNAQAALGLGWVYSNAKSWDESIAHFEKAMQLDPKLTAESYKGMAWNYTSKRDFDRARQMLDKAEAAGGGDSRLDALLDKIEARKKAGGVFDEQAAAEAEKERQEALKAQARADRINQLINAPNPGTRLQGVKELASMGAADAVGTLTWLLVNDKDYGVRIAVANTLGGFGAAAKKACPHLKSIANAPPPAPNPFATKEEQDAEMQAADLRRACRDALAKVGC
jgi:superkiller protein 3